ncbi:MAG: hypothetical protein ABI600_07210, partial [Luteolibacter sp.]
MKRFFLAALGLLLLLVSSALALVDTNDNGMSDVWERHFNSGGLFPDTFLPQDDPDGDGWSNATEAVAGTNPFEANVSDGYLRPDLAHIPAVYGTPPGGGAPVIVTPEAITLTWPTIHGKKYALLYSANLGVGSWQPLGNPFIGNGSVTQYSIPLTQPDGSTPDKLFWRVSVTDTDSDGNGVTDAEEYLLSVDNDHDGVPDEWERRVAYILFADYGITAPRNPAQFDVNANYGGINTSAALVYQNLSGNFDLATTEVVASPSVEGSMKSIDLYKDGFVQFTQLPRPPIWHETGPVLNFYKTQLSDLSYNIGLETPHSDFFFYWQEEHGHRADTESYSWSSTQGWTSTTTAGSQSTFNEFSLWAHDDKPYPTQTWHKASYNSLLVQTCDSESSGDPLSMTYWDDQVVNGQWTTTQPTNRTGQGTEDVFGEPATPPNPPVGYLSTGKQSVTFTLTQDLSDPYTTQNLIADAQTALTAATPVSQTPISLRNLVENESKISLRGGKYRFGWTIPTTVPVYPGNTQVKAVFLWQEVTDPETAPAPPAGSGRMIAWKHEKVNAAPGTLALTPWRDLPPPVKDGTSWIRPVSAHGSITFPGAILVNNDDDDANGQEDRTQTSLTLGTENDLIAVNFEATAPGADEQSLIYRLEATGAGKVRLWEAFPNQQPQLVALPYKLQTRDYTGGAGPRPTYYIEATKAGSMSLKLNAEVLGQKLALVATAEFQSLEISIDFAANMKGVIGDIVPSNLANSKAVHFVTTKSATPTDAVILTANGISGDQITPQHPNQLVEWVGAVPISGNSPTAGIPRSATGKYPVSIRLRGTGQTTASTMVWVTWANLSAQSSTQGQTPLMLAPQEIFDAPPNSTTIIGYKFSGKIIWRYVCEPTEMFNLTSDVPNFNQAPTVPAPGIHPWTGASLSPGATLRFDASRQTRIVARSNDSGIDQLMHAGHPDIMAYPSDPIEGNDDPDLGAETFPYLPLGTPAVLTRKPKLDDFRLSGTGF